MSSEKHHMTVRELLFILGVFAGGLMLLSYILTAAGYLH